MSDERSSKRPKIEEESVDANEAIAFVLQSHGRNQIFKPEMCHQLFGDDESIYGHVDPSATVLIDHSSFSYAIEFKSKQKSSSATQVWLDLPIIFARYQFANVPNSSLYNQSLSSAHCSLPFPEEG